MVLSFYQHLQYMFSKTYSHIKTNSLAQNSEYILFDSHKSHYKPYVYIYCDLYHM